MKKQFFAKHWCVGFGVVMALAACQPKVQEASRTASPSSSQSQDGYSESEDDDGDDGAYGSRDQSTHLEDMDSSEEINSSKDQVVSSETAEENVEKESSEEIVFSEEKKIEEPSQVAVLEDADKSESATSIDPRLEAVEAIRMISENYQEVTEPSSSEK